MPVWSGVNVAGVRLRDISPAVGTPDDPDNYNTLHREVVNRLAVLVAIKFTNGIDSKCKKYI